LKHLPGHSFMPDARLFTDSGKRRDVYKGANIFLNILTLFLWAFGETTCLTFLRRNPV
jgi:hypothetical protein